MPVLELPRAQVTTAAAGDDGVSLARRGKTRVKSSPRRILCISPNAEDHRVLSSMLADSSWRIVLAKTCRDGGARLSQIPVSVIFCEQTLPDGSWHDVLGYVAADGSDVPLVVTARLADEYLWAEVLNLGGFDVLAKPFCKREVLHTITSAILRGAKSNRRAASSGA
jgi:DNA-binding NtrC family response regulator